jgi:hypothetical protein
LIDVGLVCPGVCIGNRIHHVSTNSERGRDLYGGHGRRICQGRRWPTVAACPVRNPGQVEDRTEFVNGLLTCP